MEKSDSVWAVVKVAGGQYIGCFNKHNSVTSALKQVDEGGRIFMKPAFEFQMMMKPTHNGIQRQPLTVPVNVCMGEVGVWLWPTSISFFDDMDDVDKKSHHSLMEAALKDIMVSRAAASGIDLTGKMPNNPDGRFGSSV